MSVSISFVSDLDLNSSPPPGPNEDAILIQYEAAGRSELRVHPPEANVTEQLSGLIRNRRLWRDIPEAMEIMSDRCVQVLQHLGVGRDQLPALAAASTIQVVVAPQFPESCREFPWEFTLAEATRPARQKLARLNRVFAVVRHWPKPEQPRTPGSLLVVESAPGRISNEYDFESERKVVCSSLEMKSQPLVNPDLAELSAAMQANPDIVHLTGVDGIQGASILGIETNPLALPPKGMFLRGGDGVQLVQFDQLAATLTAGPAKPYMVSFNIYNSVLGAAAAVEQGAVNAIAFQDEVDDAVAEQFFAAFYAQWKRADWDVAEGFRRAWLGIGNYAARVRGTGIVLWSRLPLLDLLANTMRPAGSAPAMRRKEIFVNPDSVDDPQEHITVDFKKAERLN